MLLNCASISAGPSNGDCTRILATKLVVLLVSAMCRHHSPSIDRSFRIGSVKNEEAAYIFG